MKKIFTLVFVLASLVSLGQAPISRGHLGIGLHAACPQSELKDVLYDPGFGLNLSYMTAKFPYKSNINFQVGARMDFAGMKSKNYEVELATPAVDTGDYLIKNSMYGLLGVARMNIGWNQKLTPYVELMAGHRNYTSNTSLIAQNPDKNPNVETTAYENRVVFTQRFHYGGSLGVSYEVSPNLAFQSSVTYTVGGAGAVQPLPGLNQVGNEVRFSPETVRTDILLINLGMEIRLFKSNRTRTLPTGGTSTPPKETDTRYEDPTPPTSTKPSTSSKETKSTTPTDNKSDSPGTMGKKPGSSSTGTGTKTDDKTTTPTKKAPLEIKSNKPKKGDSSGS